MEDETLTAKADQYKNQGNTEFKKGNYQAAIDLYGQAIDYCPSNPAYFTNRAIAYLKLEDFNSAMNDCKLALSIDAKFAKAYNRLSKCHIATGDLYEASVALQKSNELEPGNPINKKDAKHLADLKITETLINKALNAEAWGKAVTNLTALLSDCTQSVKHHCLKIECLLKAFEFDEANKFSASIMKKSGSLPRHPRILCWRGKVLIYHGADVLGKKHFQQALSYDPDLKECQICMKMLKRSQNMKEEATTLFKAGKYAEAVEKFTECVTLDPLNATFNSTLLLNISIGQEKLGKKPEALAALNQAIKYNPKYSKALVRRGDYYLTQEEYTEAIRDYSEASEHDASGFNVQAKLKDAQARAKKAKRKDYFKLLGVSKDAPDAVIRKAYKKLALKWHPDKNANGTDEEKRKAEKMFRDVNEAMGVLGDKDKRDKYEQGFDLEDINSGKADMGGFGGGGMDPNDLFSMFMGGGGMGGGGHGRGGRQGHSHGFPSGGGGQPGFSFRFG